MNILLWVLQIVLAWLCIAGGAFQIFKIDQLRRTTAAMRELPRGLWAFLGGFGCLCGAGLILPGAVHLLPALTPISAAGAAVESALISALYVRYKDRAPLPFSVAMVVLGAFVAYGRFVLSPL